VGAAIRTTGFGAGGGGAGAAAAGAGGITISFWQLGQLIFTPA